MAPLSYGFSFDVHTRLIGNGQTESERIMVIRRSLAARVYTQQPMGKKKPSRRLDNLDTILRDGTIAWLDF